MTKGQSGVKYHLVFAPHPILNLIPSNSVNVLGAYLNTPRLKSKQSYRKEG
jgi:hypothetical protein